MILRRAIAALVALFAPLFGLAQLNTTRVMEIGRNALYFEDYVLSIQYFNKVIDSKPFLHEPYFYRGLAKFYLDENFVEHDEWVEGYLARVMQHEFDHLEGKVFSDRLSPLRRQMNKNKLGNLAKGKVSCAYKTKRVLR